MNHPWRWALFAILLAQSFVFGLKLTDGFYDGAKHLNWSTPFWMLKAEEMHRVRFWTDGAAGVVSKTIEVAAGRRPVEWYASHPQLIAVPIYLWTRLFGFAEWSARTLPIFMTLLTTLLLWLAARERHGERRATVFAACWAALPAVIVFGRSLEHEPLVMLFAALGILAQEKVFAGDARWRWAWPVAMTGMMWSDWSGFVFVGLLFLAQLAGARSHAPTRSLLPLTLAAGAAGLAIVVGQGILTRTVATDIPASGPVPAAAASSPVRDVLGSFWSQYYNRSGRAGGAAWDYWRMKQVQYFTANFTAILGLAGVLAGIAAHAKAFRDKGAGMTARGFFLIVALGNVIYAVILREATAVHIFYQYYYGAFVAWGLAELVGFVENALPEKRRSAALAAWAVLLAVLATSGLKTLYIQGWGGPGEVAVLKLIRQYPGASAAMIASPEDNYLANPNVEYYSGQRIWMAYPEDAVKKDLVLLAPGDAAVQRKALNYLAGPRAKFELRACSPLLCLWVKTRA